MDDFEGSYAPQSPDLSGLNDFDEPQPAFSNSYYQPQPPQFQQSFNQSPNNHNPYAVGQPPIPTSNQFSSAPRPTPSRGRGPMDDGDYVPEPTSAKGGSGRKPKKVKEVEEEVCDKPAPGVEEGIEVKTKFPVARIKRIMQADEDVGKVAQVTPTAVSKALELFMIQIVMKSADTARARSSKRVTAQHLKQALLNDVQFDFLEEILSKVPDAPTAKKKEETEESDEAMEVTKKKKKAPSKKKRKGDDDD